MDIETYVECRLRPLATLFERRAPIISRRQQIFEVGSLLANTAGAVLAVIALGNWIPATVAVASVLLALQDYFYIPSQLEANNRALQENHAMINYYESLSLVQRKTRAVKLEICKCCEDAVLAICSSRTALSPALPNQKSADKEEG